jgi:predicted PurR-regulated permease PerM
MKTQLPASEIARIVLIAGGIVAIGLLGWFLAEVLLLAFAAVLVASVLRAISDLIQHQTRLPDKVSFALACVVMAAAIGGFLVLLGVQIYDQLDALIDKLPDAISTLGDRLGISNLEAIVSDSVPTFLQNGALGSIAGLSTGVLGAVSSLVIVFVAGIFLGLTPLEYRNGLLFLFPRQNRHVVGEALDNTGRALRLWLLGQLLVMVAIGVLTYIALFFIGVPSALALAFIAGVLEFIPFLGPILAAIPALLIALTLDDPFTALWVLGAYVIVQQLENNILVPLIQRRTVSLPPALGLFALLAFGILFGILGVLLAIPLTVVLLVLVKHLYVREGLDEEVSVPGELSEEPPPVAKAE